MSTNTIPFQAIAVIHAQTFEPTRPLNLSMKAENFLRIRLVASNWGIGSPSIAETPIAAKIQTIPALRPNHSAKGRRSTGAAHPISVMAPLMRNAYRISAATLNDRQ